jgi:phosphoribosylamine--glycine ligase
MHVLVVGSGGREHAIGWALSQNKDIKVSFAPGNAGTLALGENYSLEWRDAEICKRELERLATRLLIDFVIIGPEVPLVGGVVNYLRKNKIPVFGPEEEAARLEGSKCWAKEFMSKYSIPSPNFSITSQLKGSKELILREIKKKGKAVIKADGLAYGKGSFVVTSYEEGEQVLFDLLMKRTLGAAADKLVIEEYLEGNELTIMVIMDPFSYTILPPARDYKRLKDKDQGPNTGGMGSWAPVLQMHEELWDLIEKEIILPTQKALMKEGIAFCGILYAGIMIEKDSKKPYVLEYNVRFGDPEAQAVLPLIKGNDLLSYLVAATEAKLANLPPISSPANKKSICVVMASKGYPIKPEVGKLIQIPEEEEENILIFHAGTKRDDNRFYTAGGRVLNIVGLGETLEEARAKAYSCVEKIHFEGAIFRSDIGL